MEKEGRKNEALELLNRHIGSDPDNIYLKWVEAKFTGERDFKTIENSILSASRETGAYDPGFVEKGFVFLLEILEILDI